MATPAGTPIFESPAAHETHYSNPEAHEWETHYSNPEQHEWETHEDEWETQYSNPEQHEWETPFSNPETHEAHYSNPYSPEGSPEDEQEGILGSVLGALGLGEDYSN